VVTGYNNEPFGENLEVNYNMWGLYLYVRGAHGEKQIERSIDHIIR
jgi:hypothetical protein